MNIGRQWSDRLKIWHEEFPRHYFRPWDSCALEYHTTMDYLTASEALGLPFSLPLWGPNGAKNGNMAGSGPKLPSPKLWKASG